MPVINFASETVFESNTTSGNVSLTRVQLESLVDGDYTSGGVALSGDDILALDVNLGKRIAVTDIRYYFDSVSASGTIASGISFYYKEVESDPWVNLTTTAGAGYYTTTSGNFYPLTVRVVHTISGTGIAGTLREYEVNSNEDIVDYGSDGTLTQKDLQDTPFGTSDAYTIPVYNDGDRTATAYVFIGNTGTDADEMLKLSQTQNGTYESIDDNITIDGDEYLPWSVGSSSNLTEVDNNLQLSDVSSISYSSGWLELASTLNTFSRPAGMAWHPTDPFQSVIFYIDDLTMYKYELATGNHLPVGTVPKSADSNSEGGENDLIYDPIGDRLYYFVMDTAAGNRDKLYAYYYSNALAGGGTWSAAVINNYDLGDATRSHTVRGIFFDYPGLTDSLDGFFHAGERYIVLTCSSGQSSTFRHLVFRLSDHYLAVLSASYNTRGFSKETGDCASYPSCYHQACGTAVQYENLDDYPTNTVAAIWSYAGSSDSYSYIHYYPITVSGGASQDWQAIKHQNLPRDSNIDNWYYNDDFTCRSKFFWFEDENNMLVMTSSYNNDVYAIQYERNNNRLWRRYIFAYDQGKAFFDVSVDSACIFGDSKYYDEYGRFWFMFDGYDDEIWMYFPTSYENTTYETSGTFTTPIVKNIDPTYFHVKTTIPDNTQIATTSGVITSTIEVRSSDTAPTSDDTHYVLAMTRDGVNNYNPIAMDYDGSELWRDTSQNSYTYYSYQLGCTMAINEFYPDVYNSANVYAFFGWNNRRVSYFNRLRMRLYNINGSGIYTRNRFDHIDDNNYYRITNAVFASNNMIYAIYRGLGTESDRIDVLDSTIYWVSTLEFTGDQSTLYSLCVGGSDLEDLWLIKEDQNEIRRYNQTLQLEQTVTNDDFGNLNGICRDGEGGFFVGETQAAYRKVWRYDYEGNLVTSFDVSDHVNSIHRIKRDFFGGIWVLDTSGEQIARFDRNGALIGKQSLLSPQGLSSTPAGCWVVSEVYDRHYFLNLDVDVEKQNVATDDTVISYDGDNWNGAYSKNIDVSGYLDPSDIDAADTHWGSGGDLEWSEVGKDTHFLHHKKYHQARITLRSYDSSATPEIEKVSVPPTVELPNIPPQGSRNAYMRTVVASGTQRYAREAKIRTWFDMEE